LLSKIERFFRYDFHNFKTGKAPSGYRLGKPSGGLFYPYAQANLILFSHRGNLDFLKLKTFPKKNTQLPDSGKKKKFRGIVTKWGI